MLSPKPSLFAIDTFGRIADEGHSFTRLLASIAATNHKSSFAKFKRHILTEIVCLNGKGATARFCQCAPSPEQDMSIFIDKVCDEVDWLDAGLWPASGEVADLLL